MAELVIFVLDDPDLTDEVLQAWLSVGVSGATILDSTGLSHKMGRGVLRDDLPLFPSLEDLLRNREEPHRTILVVVPDDFDVRALVAATEKITGSLDEPNTGILFTIPVTHAWGLKRRPD